MMEPPSLWKYLVLGGLVVLGLYGLVRPAAARHFYWYSGRYVPDEETPRAVIWYMRGLSLVVLLVGLFGMALGLGFIGRP